MNMSVRPTDRPCPPPLRHTHTHTHTQNILGRDASTYTNVRTRTSCCSAGEIHQGPSRQSGSIRQPCSELVLTVRLPCISSTHTHTHTHLLITEVQCAAKIWSRSLMMMLMEWRRWQVRVVGERRKTANNSNEGHKEQIAVFYIMTV